MSGSVYVQNRRAGFDITVKEHFEAGLVLTGEEIKAIRTNRVSLNGAYVKLLHGGKHEGLPEALVVGMHIANVEQPERSRRLLLHAKEIKKIQESTAIKGGVAVPLSLYLKRGWAKIDVGVGTGRKNYDKRQVIMAREDKRNQDRALKSGRRA